LVEFKFSGLQKAWSIESWILLMIGTGAFLTGTYIAYTLNLDKELVPISVMRQLLRKEKIREGRLFGLICLSIMVYAISFVVIYLVKGFLPIFVVGTSVSRVDFYVFGFGVLIDSTAFIVFFTLLYCLAIPGEKRKKLILVVLSMIALGSYFLLLQRFQIIMAIVMSMTLLFYASRHMRPRTLFFPTALAVAFFYWISSFRFSNVVSTFLYSTSKMKFPKAYALFTEPYMYVVMNLENFSHATDHLEHYTYGYFTLDFVTAIAGLKYWVLEYFGLDRMPFLFSSYNTYTAFWWFYSDFGVVGLAVIPLLLGFGAGALYYRMRQAPTIRRVTAYSVMVFVTAISFFVFPMANLWFEYNIAALYLILRWTIVPLDGADSARQVMGRDHAERLPE
jgi:oligosaccharide repeat unit polymerase